MVTVLLLFDDDPAPFEVQNGEGRSPVPRDLRSRGAPPAEIARLARELSDDDLARHIAWDLGASAVAQRLAAALDATLIRQTYSRLVIDCNRPLAAADSIAGSSERTLIPGNQCLSPSAAEARAREVFHPYHDAIVGALARRERDGLRTVLVAMHSFTPVFLDVARPWHVGVLYNRDARLAEPLLRLLRSESDLVVGDNEPYAVSDLSDFSILEHGERRGIHARRARDSAAPPRR